MDNSKSTTIAGAVCLSCACVVAMASLFLFELIHDRDWKELAAPAVVIALAVLGCVAVSNDRCDVAFRVAGLAVGVICILIALVSLMDALQ